MLASKPSDNALIHPTAIVDSNAKIGNNVKIGPYCVVGSRVQLDDNVELHSHVVIEGNTTIGEGTVIYPFASIGHAPQDLKYNGENSKLTIGKFNKIREYVTCQPGTTGDRMETTIGDNCLLMASAHVAHDCVVGNNVIMANNATLAGHVTIGDFVIIGGLSAIQQFVRVGAHAIIGGMSGVEKDVIPYGLVKGERAYLEGLNLVGLKRRGFNSQTIQTLIQAYDTLFDTSSNTPFSERVKQAHEKFDTVNELEILFNFIKESQRPLCQPSPSKSI
jgi:UDP-N-acetylglucosamine acyltransferase